MKNLLKHKNVVALILVFLVIIGFIGLWQVFHKERGTTASISITSEGFIPNTLHIMKGTKVTWTNHDSAPHKLMANPYPEGSSLPGLKSGDLGPKQEYSYTFDKTGSVSYTDANNPVTNGSIVVQ